VEQVAKSPWNGWPNARGIRTLDTHAIQAISADDFIADTIELNPSEAILALRRMRERFRNPALDVASLIHKSEAQGLLQVATFMDEYQSFL